VAYGGTLVAVVLRNQGEAGLSDVRIAEPEWVVIEAV
jgi:hypothetical protein